MCEHTLDVVKLYANVKYVLHFKICQLISLKWLNHMHPSFQSTRDLAFSGPCGRGTKSELCRLNGFFILETMKFSKKINIL